jgi:hypothetical protein
MLLLLLLLFVIVGLGWVIVMMERKEEGMAGPQMQLYRASPIA